MARSARTESSTHRHDRAVSRARDVCPECGVALRAFAKRLCCDSCGGIFLGVADFVGAIDDLVKIEPRGAFVRECDGNRPCPRCGGVMSRCYVTLAMLDRVIAPEVELDRCGGHAIWLGPGKLTEVLAAVEREVNAEPPIDRMWRGRRGFW